MNDLTPAEVAMYVDRLSAEKDRAAGLLSREHELRAKASHETLEQARIAGDDRLRDSIDAQRRGCDKFEASVQERFKQVNEFRGALEDLSKLMATRRDLENATEKFDQAATRNREDIGDLTNKVVLKDSNEAVLRDWTAWRGGMDKWRNETAGKGEGVSATFKIITSAIGAVVLLLGLFSAITAYGNRNKLAQLPDAPVTITTTVTTTAP